MPQEALAQRNKVEYDRLQRQLEDVTTYSLASSAILLLLPGVGAVVQVLVSTGWGVTAAILLGNHLAITQEPNRLQSISAPNITVAVGEDKSFVVTGHFIAEASSEVAVKIIEQSILVALDKLLPEFLERRGGLSKLAGEVANILVHYVYDKLPASLLTLPPPGSQSADLVLGSSSVIVSPETSPWADMMLACGSTPSQVHGKAPTNGIGFQLTARTDKLLVWPDTNPGATLAVTVGSATPPSLSIKGVSFRPGDLVQITGSSFPPGALITLIWVKPDNRREFPGQPVADARGNLVFSFRVPLSAAPGIHTVQALVPAAHGPIPSVQFTVGASNLSPFISSITPPQVAPDQPTWLTVSGRNFQQGFSAEVRTGAGPFAIDRAGLMHVSASQVRVQVTMRGPAPYRATLSVANPGGLSASSTFDVVAPPRTTALMTTPGLPLDHVRFNFTMSGTGFDAATAQVVFTGPGCELGCPVSDAHVTSRTVTQVSGWAALAAGNYAAAVRNGPSAPLSNSQPLAVAAPQISNLTTSPSPPQVAQPFNFTITGSNFDPSSIQVLFNGRGCNPCQVPDGAVTTRNPTVVAGSAQLNTAGPYNVTVRHGSVGTASNSRPLTVGGATPAPVITGISPASPQVQVGVNQTITVFGTGFQSGLTVTAFFPGGGSSTLSGGQIQSVTSGSFQVLMMLNTAGTWGIRVKNPDNQQSNTFSFNVI